MNSVSLRTRSGVKGDRDNSLAKKRSQNRNKRQYKTEMNWERKYEEEIIQDNPRWLILDTAPIQWDADQ